MKKQKSGSIINLSSIYGFLGPDFYIYKDTAMTMPAAYSVIKGGIINFTRYLASYYGKYKIRINCISPGGVYCKQPRVFVKRYIQNTPLGRMAYKEDIVGAVIYLASDSARYVTGHNLVVDGGLSII
jgi:NAD(P)-dependent dehydrogenase (short-subunit alcohol dehydrogenase family)